MCVCIFFRKYRKNFDGTDGEYEDDGFVKYFVFFS